MRGHCSLLVLWGPECTWDHCLESDLRVCKRLRPCCAGSGPDGTTHQCAPDVVTLSVTPLRAGPQLLPCLTGQPGVV